MPNVLKAIDYDLENTVFSYIPNTAEVAFGGLVEGIDEHINKLKATESTKGCLNQYGAEILWDKI